MSIQICLIWVYNFRDHNGILTYRRSYWHLKHVVNTVYIALIAYEIHSYSVV